jgi:hypothetical protein
MFLIALYTDVSTLVVETLSLTNLKEPFNDNYINSAKATLAPNVDLVIIKRLKTKKITKEVSNEEKEQYGIHAVEKFGPYGWYEQHFYFR